MSAAPAPIPARRSGGLTPRGVAVALTYRLRQAVEMLPPSESAELLAELRELVSVYAPPRRLPNAG
jgi:hypothetical protein